MSASPRTAAVLYGTETGNAQDLAGETSLLLERLHFQTEIQEFDHATPLSLNQFTLVVFVLSTTGQGEFPSNSRKLWLSLRRKKLASSFLSGVSYAVVGLCDSSYPKFNLAARKLDKRLQQLGATSFVQRCEADEQGEDGTEGAFIAWSQVFKDALLSKYPLKDGVKPLPDTVRLPSKWVLAEVDPRPENHDQNGSNGTVSAAVSHASPEKSFKVTLQKTDRVTPQGHWQDVRFLSLRTDTPIAYMPGDALAIRPENTSEDVDALMLSQDWQDIADRPLRFRLNRGTSTPQKAPDPVFDLAKGLTLRRLLATYLDINAIPRRSFFANIAHFTTDEMQKERALEFADSQYLDEYFDYATRPRRSILEVLQEFDTIKIPWQEVTNVFPILRPRQFSIASGGSLKDGGRVFHLLVAIVKYRTVIKRIREGVCTRYLARLPVGTALNVVLHTEGRFHVGPSLYRSNHLLVAGGTGIAPVRALIHEKSSLTRVSTSTTLIFGCRSHSADYFFGNEWTMLADVLNEVARPMLTTVTAFSRDQEQKVYVQDRIREHARHVKELLLADDSTIVVCGSSGAMPRAVRQALLDVLRLPADADNGDVLSEEEAEEVLAELEKTDRYKQETW